MWQLLEKYSKEYKSCHTIETIKENTAIRATREAYKSLGKEPNRYRPSAEALCRPILKDLPLYKINTLVDIINLVSVCTGYSIGGFDTEKIEGDTLTLDVGIANEPFEAIGRGYLNIENLPVYRDSCGAIGTPTSDNERTKLDVSTMKLLAIVNVYNGNSELQEAALYIQSLLKEFANCQHSELIWF